MLDSTVSLAIEYFWLTNNLINLVGNCMTNLTRPWPFVSYKALRWNLPLTWSRYLFLKRRILKVNPTDWSLLNDGVINHMRQLAQKILVEEITSRIYFSKERWVIYSSSFTILRSSIFPIARPSFLKAVKRTRCTENAACSNSCSGKQVWRGAALGHIWCRSLQNVLTPTV
jgi:hypothetical protein